MSTEFEPPRTRRFEALWLTQSVSGLGSAVSFFALIFWLGQVAYAAPAQRGQLGLAVALVGAIGVAARLLVAPFAGALADRYERRVIMVAANVASAATVGAMAVLLARGRPTLPALLVFAGVNGAAAATHLAAFGSAIPLVVPKRNLARASALLQASTAGASLAGPALGALLVAAPGLARHGSGGGAAAGAPLAFAVDALSFVFAAVALAFIPLPRVPRAADAPPRGGLWSDVAAGWRWVTRDRALLQLLGVVAAANVTLGGLPVATVLLLRGPLAASTPGAFDVALAAITSAAAAGALVGGVATGVWGGLRPPRRVIGVLVSLAAAGVAVALVGAARTLSLAIGATFAANLAVLVSNAHSEAIWQSQTPLELQGRVMALRRSTAQVSLPVGMVVAGAASAHVSAPTYLLVTGLALAALCSAQLANARLIGADAASARP